MAGTVNKAILIGNVGKDPEVRYLENGAAVTTIPIATSEDYTDKTTGEKKSVTDWHNITLWRGLAEIAKNYVKKGTKIYVEGKIRTRSYIDKDNIVRYTTEIVADQMQILTPKSENNPDPSSHQSVYPPSVEDATNKTNIENMHTDQEDDLPF
jgi:single-strand DNA-binding protein